MAKADVMAGRAYVSLYAKTDQLTKALKTAQKDLNEFGSGIMGIGAGIAGMGAAITTGLTGALLHFADTGSALNDLSASTGISTTALAELGYAADMTGGSMEAVESAIGKMQKNLGGVGEESAKVKAGLEAMGLSVAQISGLAPEEQFQAIAEAIGAIEDPSQQSAAAMAVFGNSGRDLLPMMKDIKALREEARELGIAPSPESIAAADAIGDAIDRVRKVVGSAFFEIGAAVAPMAMELLDGFLTVAKAVRNFIQQNKALVVTVAKVGLALMAAGGVIIGVGSGFAAAGMAISGFLSVMSAFAAVGGVVVSVLGAVGAAVMTVFSPVGLLVAALLSGVYAWARFTESGRAAVSQISTFITETFGGLLTTVKDTFGGIVAAIQAGDLALAGQIALVGLKLVFAQGLEGITGLFGESMGKIASQIMEGDLAGAWSTLGVTILDSVANIASGMVNLFTNAANAVMSKWQETVDGISDYILKAASEGGVMGWALEQISGVNMQEEAARAARLNAQAGAMGMSQDAGIVDSSQYQDPGLEAMKNKVKAAGDAANAMMAGATDATGQAVADATSGQAAEASEAVKSLQAELAALRAQAAEKLAAVQAGEAEKTGSRVAGGFGFGGSGGKASAASFNLASLMSVAGGSFESKQLSALDKSVKAQEKQTEQMDELIVSVQSWSLHHA